MRTRRARGLAAASNVMQPQPTKTLNPLPFEHLEPRRFEDLTRQLVYDFRRWRQLEATGRSGSDDGFDVRGWEIAGDDERAPDDAESGDGDDAPPPPEDRLWLIQCKREKSIGPGKIVAQLEAISPAALEGLHGLVFVAACDLSKRTRDACREWCRSRGVQEIYVWGRGEIEDLLYQPKNDHLLFAYFGISLQIRKKATMTALRRVTTIKRKLKRLLADGGWPGRPVILRDPSDSRYPWTEGEPLREGGFLWRPAAIKSLGPNGLRVVVRCLHAFYRYETSEWDVASTLNRAVPPEGAELWDVEREPDQPAPDAIQAWSNLPRGNQAFLFVLRDLAYDDIIEIDEIGDDRCSLPTIYVTFRGGEPPFAESGDHYLEMSQYGARQGFHHDRRVRLFDDELRDQAWEERWQTGTGGKLPTERYQLNRLDDDQ